MKIGSARTSFAAAYLSALHRIRYRTGVEREYISSTVHPVSLFSLLPCAPPTQPPRGTRTYLSYVTIGTRGWGRRERGRESLEIITYYAFEGARSELGEANRPLSVRLTDPEKFLDRAVRSAASRWRTTSVGMMHGVG